jgi:hypothetical protein
MHVQDLKRWHWVAIALVVGLALSYVWTSVEPSIPRTMAPRTFEQLLVTPPEQGRPWIANLTVHPPDEGVYIVTGEELTTQQGSKNGLYKPFQIVTRTPYVPGGAGRAPAASGSNETILTYLDRVAAQHPHVRYRYAWERKPMWVYTFWTVGSLLLIGGVWPSLVSLLTGGGLGLTRDKDDNGYDLSRFSSTPEAGTAKPAATTAGASQLASVEAELEQKLAGFAITGAADDAGGATAGQTRKLDGKPLEPVPAQAEEEDKEYKGEFYPVARPHVPHHDAKKDG